MEEKNRPINRLSNQYAVYIYLKMYTKMTTKEFGEEY